MVQPTRKIMNEAAKNPKAAGKKKCSRKSSPSKKATRTAAIGNGDNGEDRRLPQNGPQQRRARVRKHPEYGTSKLEERFARDFLDRLNVEYVYQYKAESIGRFYDFYLPKENLLIEVDGVYWHSKDILYEDMTPTQKRNRRVDELKDRWAALNCIPLIRIWEDDINKHPESVMNMLKERLGLRRAEIKREEWKKHRH